MITVSQECCWLSQNWRLLKKKKKKVFGNYAAKPLRQTGLDDEMLVCTKCYLLFQIGVKSGSTL